MFTISYKSENGFSIIILKDEKSGCYAEIIPGCGAILHAFGIKNSHTDIQVIDHYQSKQEFENAEALGHKGSKLSPFVCRLGNSRYTFDGKDFEIINATPGKHAIHGLLYTKSFGIISEEADSDQATAKMKYSYKRENPGYPFDYDCIITYSLVSKCTLQVRTECINLSEQTIPMQDGWHPYFDLGKRVDEIELRFPSISQYVFDDELLPTGEKISYNKFASMKPIGDQHIDNSFVLDPQVKEPVCTLLNGDAGFEVQVLPSPSYPILQVYTPEHRRSIAIENLSGPPNAFNLGKGFIPLQAGQSTVFETAYRINII